MHELARAILDQNMFIPQAVEGIASIGQESDQEFVAKTGLLLQYVKPRIRDIGQRVLDKIPVVGNSKHVVSVIFVPIRHTQDRSIELKMRLDLEEVLKRVYQLGDVVVNGEGSSNQFSKPEMLDDVRRSSRLIYELGGFTRQQYRGANVKLNGFEEALISFSKNNPKAICIGGDSNECASLCIAISLNPIVAINGESDAEHIHELHWRMEKEARTRYALNLAIKKSPPGRRIIFVQGYQHLEAVKAWAQRSNIQTVVTVGKFMLEKFDIKR